MKFNLKLIATSALFMQLAVFFFACNKLQKETIKPFGIVDEPDYFKIGNPNPTSNSIVHLGRVLFYDKALSVNNGTSCASCHKQAFAFADNVAKSAGFENKLTPRNSIALQNIRGNNFFGSSANLFWDGREEDLFSLVQRPLVNHIEMGIENTDALVQKLNKLDYYTDLVKKAFPSSSNVNTLDYNKVANAISAFVLQLNSNGSKSNQVQQNKAIFNAMEIEGANLFVNTYHCNNCHTFSAGYYSSNGGFANIGLDAVDTDLGRAKITNNKEDNGSFKIPDLHNVAITAPYMHDGRFKSLDEVLDHYSHQIQPNKNLSPLLADLNGQPINLEIKPQHREALKAFLGSLTDYTIVTNSNFSSPFVQK